MRSRRTVLSLHRRPASASLLALSLGLSGCELPEGAKPFDPVEYQWAEEPTDGAWKAIGPLQDIPRDGHDERSALWFRVAVPACDEPDPALRLRAMLATSFEEMRIDGARLPITDAVPLLPLPRSNVTVLLRARPALAAISPEITLGSQRALWIAGVRREIPEVLVAGALALAGLLLLASALRRGAAKAYRGLGVFLLAMGVMALESLSFTRALVFPSARFTYYVFEVAGYVLPFGYGAFVLAIFGDTKRKLLGRGARVYAVITALVWAFVLAVGPAQRLDDLRAASNAFILFQSAVVLALATRRVRAGDRAAKAFLYGFALLILISLPDILDGMGFFTLQFQTVPYAALAFGAAMTIVTERRMAETRDALAVSAGELSSKLAALEEKNREVLGLNVELRHQIAERSKDLATVLRAGVPAQGPARELREGDVIGGRYRVIRALGKGGMGTVHEVERTSDGKRFALKVMSGSPHPTAAARFAREAEIAARIADPHLVSVVDVSSATSDTLYLVMELVHGRSLEEARASFGDVAWGLPVLAQIAEGLAALHEAGVVHRDLKPGNVLLARARPPGDSVPTLRADTGAEVAKISDFGISRLGPGDEDSLDASERPARGAPEPDTVDSPSGLWPADTETREAPVPAQSNKTYSNSLTATGVVMGTPAYMAPELGRGARRAKPASDVFALGLIAHEVLTGRPAFTAPPVQLALAHKPLPEIASLPDSVPPDVASLIRSCLAEAPSRRPAIAEAALVLGRAAAELPEKATA